MTPLALTMGDPAGIGGELSVLAWLARRSDPDAVFFAIDDPARLAECARAMDLSIDLAEIAAPAEATAAFGDALPVLPERLVRPALAGQPLAENAAVTVRSIERAVALAMAGEAAGVVTNPINKLALYEGAGFAFPGHTEFLADLAGVPRTVMMLAAPALRVVPVTIHLSLRDAIEAVTGDEIIETARIVARTLQTDFGLSAPRIAVSGLNPHAGEGGTMGREEIEIIMPALDTLRAEGIDVAGPLPADTMFHEGARSRYDAALCMYHDQALIPLKTLDFHGGVNVTLGMPFVRTSPDHGTAYDIAGKGIARADSLIAALDLARQMANRRAAA